MKKNEPPSNGHAHAVWALAEPVTRNARRKPLAYAAAVIEGLHRAVDGDTVSLLPRDPEPELTAADATASVRMTWANELLTKERHD